MAPEDQKWTPGDLQNGTFPGGLKMPKIGSALVKGKMHFLHRKMRKIAKNVKIVKIVVFDENAAFEKCPALVKGKMALFALFCENDEKRKNDENALLSLLHFFAILTKTHF